MNDDPPEPQERIQSTQPTDPAKDKPPLLPDVVREEVRKRLPPEVTAFGVQVAMGAAPNAFIEKLQPEHIDKVLDYTRDEKTQEHRRLLTYYVLGIPAFLILCGIFLYAGRDSMLKEILSAFIGFAGGFGVGKWSGKK